jgi:hypothetical protein
MQGQVKRNMGGRKRLLDRNGEPSDQARHLIELIGIMVLDRARKAREAFIVAHQRHGSGYDRGNRSSGVNRGHQGTSRIEPAEATILADLDVLASGSSQRWHFSMRAQNAGGSFCMPRNHCAGTLPAVLDTLAGLPISALQGRMALLYATRLRRLFRSVPW